jgi:hypothetical protein
MTYQYLDDLEKEAILIAHSLGFETIDQALLFLRSQNTEKLATSETMKTLTSEEHHESHINSEIGV